MWTGYTPWGTLLRVAGLFKAAMHTWPPNQLWRAISLDHIVLDGLCHTLSASHLSFSYFAPSPLQRPPPLRRSNKKREASTWAGYFFFGANLFGKKVMGQLCATISCLIHSAQRAPRDTKSLSERAFNLQGLFQTRVCNMQMTGMD